MSARAMFDTGLSIFKDDSVQILYQQPPPKPPQPPPNPPQPPPNPHPQQSIMGIPPQLHPQQHPPEPAQPQSMLQAFVHPQPKPQSQGQHPQLQDIEDSDSYKD
ncbi:Histone acetyltransferase kat6a [Cichlidogyrus casuarinus]|uniref:Histone acetyltransferase kat6a n=1 Tax=Cichlidogyrus casuarinus TaxID=1844966 RepID=A0ABD2PVG7_9PLAT